MAIFFRKLMALLTKVENFICTAGLFGTTFLITFQILNRFWLRLDIKWVNDFALFMFIFFVFFAIVLTTREDGHTTVDLFVDILFDNHPIGRAVYTLCMRLLCVVTLVAFLPTTFSFAVEAWKYPQPGNLVRWFNESWLMESLFVCMLLCLLHLIYNICMGIIRIREQVRASRKVGEN